MLGDERFARGVERRDDCRMLDAVLKVSILDDVAHNDPARYLLRVLVVVGDGIRVGFDAEAVFGGVCADVPIKGVRHRPADRSLAVRVPPGMAVVVVVFAATRPQGLRHEIRAVVAVKIYIGGIWRQRVFQGIRGGRGVVVIHANFPFLYNMVG